MCRDRGGGGVAGRGGAGRGTDELHRQVSLTWTPHASPRTPGLPVDQALQKTGGTACLLLCPANMAQNTCLKSHLLLPILDLAFPPQNTLIEGRHHPHHSKFLHLQETVDTFVKHTTQFPGLLTTAHSACPFPARPQPGELPQGHKVSKPWPLGGHKTASRGSEAARGQDAIPALPPQASALLCRDQRAGRHTPGHHAPPALMCWSGRGNAGNLRTQIKGQQPDCDHFRNIRSTESPAARCQLLQQRHPCSHLRSWAMCFPSSFL